MIKGQKERQKVQEIASYILGGANKGVNQILYKDYKLMSQT